MPSPGQNEARKSPQSGDVAVDRSGAKMALMADVMDEGLQIGFLYPGDIGTGFFEFTAIKGAEPPHGVGIGGNGVSGKILERACYSSGFATPGASKSDPNPSA